MSKLLGPIRLVLPSALDMFRKQGGDCPDHSLSSQLKNGELMENVLVGENTESGAMRELW